MVERLDFINDLIKDGQKVSFDFDGVLSDSRAPVLDEFNKIVFEKTGIKNKYKYEDVTGWDSLYELSLKLGYKEKEAREFNFNIWTDPFILRKAKPLEDGLEVYRSFMKKDCVPPIITVRNKGLRDVTFEWFKEYLPEVPKNKINIRDNEPIDGNDFKIGKILENNVNWHFDDSEEITKLILRKLNKAKVVHIAPVPNLEIARNKRVVVIPYWEWSPRT